MNSASEDIKDMLVDNSSLGLVFGTDLFIGKIPTTPANCITIRDTSGGIPDISLDSSSFYNPTVQIIVRNTDYTVGYTLIENIRESLHGRAQETWNGTLYSVITAQSDIGSLGWDDNDRALFSINFNMKRR